jgi:transposase
MQEELIFNYLLDQRKKEISKWDRAKLIGNYIREQNISQRELARRLGMPKSTIEDWLLLDRLTKDQYNTLKKRSGDRDIYRMLRNNKQKTVQEIMQPPTNLDKILQKAIQDLKGVRYVPTTSVQTIVLLKQLQDILSGLTVKLNTK